MMLVTVVGFVYNSGVRKTTKSRILRESSHLSRTLTEMMPRVCRATFDQQLLALVKTKSFLVPSEIVIPSGQLFQR